MAKLLVIDDDAVVLDMFKDIVEFLGHTAITMPNAASALEYLESGKTVDLMITDIMMPGLMGDDMVARILDNPDIPEFPIIIVSGVKLGRRGSALLKHEHIAFISKPIRVNKLVKTIDALLMKSGAVLENS